MSNKGPTKLYKKQWYSKKKKSTNSHNTNKNKNKHTRNDERARQSLNPTEINNLLSRDNPRKSSNVPYYGWKLFFPDEEYKTDSPTVQKIKIVESFIDREHHLLSLISLKNLETDLVFPVNLCNVYSDEIFLTQWPDFNTDIHENPIHTLNCFKLAIHQKIFKTASQENLETLVSSLTTLPTVRLRILNYQPITCLRYLKIISYGKLISTAGCIIRVGRVKCLAQWIIFACTKCNLEKTVKQSEGIYTAPKRCDVCGVSKFCLALDSPNVKTVSFQLIKVQELLNDEQENKGTMPRVLDVELIDDLVNTCMPGDDVTLTGIMKGTNDSTTKAGATNSFSLYMEAITIIKSKDRNQSKGTLNTEMSLKDHLAIKEVFHTPNIFPLLVHSLCPGIYGHEMIKAGLILSLFGGNEKHSQLREDIHVLVVGDPGLGKSQMLQACTRVAIKGVYICGNSSTSSGLTITLSKENGTNDFALEPGALVLADGGCCCIDEFDKMSAQHPALLESMEQQSVSVAKSGIVCSLPARTSILAAANPIGGRYGRSKTMIQNLNMSQPLLSRFDLVFLLLDEPDKDMDDLLCQHVLTVHTGSNQLYKSKSNGSQSSPRSSNAFDCTLRERLSSSSGNSIDLIPQVILRKYISYAKQYVKPKLSGKAAHILQEYYLELRSRNEGIGGLSVYNRQLEAMIRLTEARAKLELRVEATEADALDVVEILRYTMTDTLDNDIIPTLEASGNGRLTGGKVKAFMTILKNETKSNKEMSFSMSRLKEIAESGRVFVDDFYSFVSKLNEQGILLKTGRNSFKFISD